MKDRVQFLYIQNGSHRIWNEAKTFLKAKLDCGASVRRPSSRRAIDHGGENETKLLEHVVSENTSIPMCCTVAVRFCEIVCLGFVTISKKNHPRNLSMSGSRSCCVVFVSENNNNNYEIIWSSCSTDFNPHGVSSSSCFLSQEMNGLSISSVFGVTSHVGKPTHSFVRLHSFRLSSRFELQYRHHHCQTTRLLIESH